MTTKQAVVFAILMETGNGIVFQSPGYIREKLEVCMSDENPEHLLDLNNLAKLKKWQKTWNQH